MINRPKWITPEGKTLTLSVGIGIRDCAKHEIYHLVDEERRVINVPVIDLADNQDEAAALIDAYAQLRGWKRMPEAEKETAEVSE